MNGQAFPPLRVGDFILTFPFNTPTLRASQSHKPDVKIIIQEIHKLTARLATSDKKLKRKDEEVKKDKCGEEDFDSLLWGPKDPPLLSQCIKPT